MVHAPAWDPANIQIAWAHLMQKKSSIRTQLHENATQQHVLQLKIPPPGTQQRATSTPQRDISSSCSLCFHFMELYATFRSIHTQQSKKGRTSLPCSRSATESHAAACSLHAAAWDPACCYINQRNTFVFASPIQFLILDAVAIPSSQTHQKLICKKKFLHTHLPNIHAFLTTIHLSLIKSSLLTLPQIPNSPF